MLTLYPDQQQLVHDVRAVFRAGASAPLLVLPTGGGKTVIFTHIAEQAAAKGSRVLLLAHRRELIFQISRALTRWNCPHGMISPNHPETGEPVQVAMAQTLARRVRLDQAGRHRYDLIIVDEAHHATPDTTWGAILKHNEGAKLLGVSATPCRLDGKGLGVEGGGFFDAMVCGPTVSELMERGRLARAIVYQPEKPLDMSGVKKRGGDYVAGQLYEATARAGVTYDAIKHYAKHAAGRPAAAFCINIDHAESVCGDFRAAGWSSAVLTGSTPDRERDRLIADLGEGRLNILCTCNVISEGTDIPTLEVAILLRRTASYGLAMQQMGRVLRPAPGKEAGIIIDCVGNTLQHGPPDDPVSWSLEGFSRSVAGRREFGACRKCGSSTYRAGAAHCPICGSPFASRDKPEAAQVMLPLPSVMAGDLIELDPERRALWAQQRAWRQQAERAARSLEDFQAIGQAMGYKPGWAYYRYKELKRMAG